MSFVIPIVGLLLIYVIYLKALTSSGAQRTLSSGSFWKENPQNNRIYYLDAKLKQYYLTIALVSGFNVLFIFANVRFNFLAAWFVFVITGTLWAFCLWLLLDIGREWNSLPVSDFSESRIQPYIKPSHNEVISPYLLVIFILILSFNWAYQVEKGQTLQKQNAANEVLNISGTGWCANFSDINVYNDEGGNYGANKDGGWPCINVAAITNINFSKKKDELNLCLSYDLEYSDGLPSESVFVKDYEVREVCASDNWLKNNGGWDQKSFERKIFARLENELSNLQNTLCLKYSDQLSYEEQNVYCNG
jgi:hypothetical protein